MEFRTPRYFFKKAKKEKIKKKQKAKEYPVKSKRYYA